MADGGGLIPQQDAPGGMDISSLLPMLAQAGLLGPQGGQGPAPTPTVLQAIDAAQAARQAPQQAPQGPPPGVPQGAPQMAPQQGAQFAPQFQPVTGVPGFLDQLLLHGTAERMRERSYQAQMQGIQTRNLQARYQQIAQTEGPDAAQMFITQPDLYNKLHEPVNAAAGSTEFMNGKPYVAPTTGVSSGGQFYAFGGPGQGAFQPLGSPMAGQQSINAESGAVIDQNRGLTGQSVPIPQKLAPGERVAPFGTYTGPQPGAGAPVPFGAPQLPPSAGTAPSVPPPIPGSPPQLGAPTVMPGPGGPVAAAVRAEAIRQGVDPDLAVRVGLAESNLNPNTPPSSKGARGTMQLMPGTARALGVDPSDPAQNIRGGVAYLAQLQQQFPGRPDLVAAAYNAGPGAVAKYGGVPPYKETQGFVQKVTGPGPTPSPAANAPRIGQPAPQPGGFMQPNDPNAPQGPLYSLAPPGQFGPGGPVVVGPDGKPMARPGALEPGAVATRGQQFMASDQYKQTANAVSAVNGLQSAILNVPRGGSLSMATMDTFLRSINPGMGVRGNTVRVYLEHLGLPQEIASHWSEFQGQGFIPAATARDILGVARSYAAAHAGELQAQHAGNVAWAQHAGYGEADLGVTIPSVNPITSVPPWLQDARPMKPVAGKTYWTPKGPLKFDGKGYLPQ